MTFQCNFSVATLQRMLPRNREVAEWHHYMSQILPDFEIVTKQRVAAFVAQCSHESLQFRVMEENLNYSADGLLGTWPRRFTSRDMAMQYARQPQKIANFVYANRNGNGPTSSNDGWNYRGRGIIQLTGRRNYTDISTSIYGDDRAVRNPAMVVEKQQAIYAACWFWYTRNLNELADRGDITTMTERINGGRLGLPERRKYYLQGLEVF